MPTPLSRLTTAQLTALLTTQLGALKPYQLEQVQDVLSRVKFERGSNSDVSVQPTISTITTSLSTNNP
jgi:hypothetical protein